MTSLRSRRQIGFTLLELLVVLVIIGLLVAVVGPRYFSQLGKSEDKIAHAQMDALGKALDQYRIDNGHFPSSAQGLQALFVAPANEAHWSGPYLKKSVPADPWGHPYVYASPGQQGDYDLSVAAHDGSSNQSQ